MKLLAIERKISLELKFGWGFKRRIIRMRYADYDKCVFSNNDLVRCKRIFEENIASKQKEYWILLIEQMNE